ncbi:MAG: TadE family protein [Chloroflexota bacterium]
MRASIRRAIHSDLGQGLVEFALVVPLIMLLLIVAVDGGRAVIAYNALANAARHGARVAAVNQLMPNPQPSTCNEDMPIEDVTQPHWSAKACAAASASYLNVNPSNVSVTFSVPTDVPQLVCTAPSNLHPGCIATVSLAADWQAITPVVAQLLGTIHLTATSAMPIERVFP